MSSQTSPELALQFSAVVVAATVVVAPAVVAATVVASELTVVVTGLAVVGAEVDAEEQAPLTQDSPVAQEPVYSL